MGSCVASGQWVTFAGGGWAWDIGVWTVWYLAKKRVKKREKLRVNSGVSFVLFSIFLFSKALGVLSLTLMTLKYKFLYIYIFLKNTPYIVKNIKTIPPRPQCNYAPVYNY